MCVRCTMLVTTPSPFAVHICWLFSNCNYFNVIDRKRCRLHMWVGCSLCLASQQQTCEMIYESWIRSPDESIATKWSHKHERKIVEHTNTREENEFYLIFILTQIWQWEHFLRKEICYCTWQANADKTFYNPCYKCGSLHHLTIYTLELQNVAGIGYYCDMTNKHE